MEATVKEKQHAALRDFADGKPVKSEQNKLRKIEVRVTPEEYEHIKLIAGVTHLSISEMIRQLCTGANLKALPPELFYDVLDELYDAKQTILEVFDHEPCLDRALDRMCDIIGTFKETVKDFYGGTNGVNYRSYVQRFNDEHAMTPEELAEWQKEWDTWQEMIESGDY